MSAAAVADRRPLVEEDLGRFRDPRTGEVIDTTRIRDDFVIDSAGLPAGVALTAGGGPNFFLPITGVLSKQHFTVTRGRRNQLPAKTAVLAMERVGLYFQQAIGNDATLVDDVVKLACLMSLRFELNSRDLVYDGPVIGAPAGLGVWGATGDGSSPIATLGSPTLAARAAIAPRWPILPDDSLAAALRGGAATWFNDANHAGAAAYSDPILTNPTAITFVVRGPIATW